MVRILLGSFGPEFSRARCKFRGISIQNTHCFILQHHFSSWTRHFTFTLVL
ncbi:hypothetical protein TorRG33x02_021140 [Trema orientale]|uniref:Uncharacterized protein n=1 Tax=Trema orientale TaxID=63057 RepID=A0A2P5FX16_TREOI|nr:hypothetical protein TorRG33x02_021140 [Trema orientale]